MSEIFDVHLFNTALRTATPLILAALGGLLSERVGVINIGLEGKMLMGAFAGAWAGLQFHNPWIGILFAILAGLLLASIHAYATQQWKADHVVSGVAINVLAAGLSTYLFRRLIEPLEQEGGSSVVMVFGSFEAKWLDSIPLLGGLLKGQNWMVVFAVLLPFVLHWTLKNTRWGLRVYAVGNDSVKSRTMGVPVVRMRYLGVLLSGVLAALAGAFLTLASTGQFRENMSAGKGFIALAALIFGRWSPLGAAAAAFGFAFFDALQIRLQNQPVFGVQLPTDLLLALPYLLTVIALFGLFGKMKPPQDLGKG